MTLLMESIKAVNLPYTVMLLVVIVYWSTVILGFFDIESLDFDVEMEHEGVLGAWCISWKSSTLAESRLVCGSAPSASWPG